MRWDIEVDAYGYQRERELGLNMGLGIRPARVINTVDGIEWAVRYLRGPDCSPNHPISVYGL